MKKNCFPRVTCLFLAVSILPLHAIAQLGQIDFDGPVAPGKVLNISGVAGDAVSVYSVTSTTQCSDLPHPGSPASVPAGNALQKLVQMPAPANDGITTLLAAKQQITLAAAVNVGTLLCLTARNGNDNFSSAKPAMVTAPAQALQLVGKPVAGSTSVTVLSQIAADIYFYSLPASYKLKSPAAVCSADDTKSADATFLRIGPRGADSYSVDANVNTTLQLTNNLGTGSQLCLVGKSADGTLSYSALTAVSDGAGQVNFNGKVAPGMTVSVSGTQGENVSLYALKTGSVCPKDAATKGTLLKINPGAVDTFPLPSSTTDLALAVPVIDGDTLCLIGPPASTSPNTASTNFATTNVVGFIRFASTPAAGDKVITVEGDTGVGATLQAYRFPSTFKPATGSSCTQADLTSSNGMARIALLGKDWPDDATSNPRLDSITIPAPTPPSVTSTIHIADPLSAGDVLCLEEDANGDVFSTAVTVAGPPSVTAEPTFAHSFYTVGAVISNQLSNSNSTSAAEYVDLGFTFKFRNEGTNHRPGLNTSVSGRFSSLPVAAGTPADTTQTLNVLSSQESARVMGTVFMPFRVGRTSGEGDSLYAGPLGKASFSTLINPSAQVAPAQGTDLVDPKFSATYNDWSIGGRIGWRRYLASSAVQTIWQLDGTIGKFTNLEDIFCNHRIVTKGQAAPTNTNCYGLPDTSVTPTTYTTFRPDRVANPRLELDGFAHIPGTIFVIGIDANLSQYEFGNKYTDTMNRAGSDVRIYFGITGSISDLFKKLSLPTAP